MVWYGMTGRGMVWYGNVLSGTEGCGMEWYSGSLKSLIFYQTFSSSTQKENMVCYGILGLGMVWYGFQEDAGGRKRFPQFC